MKIHMKDKTTPLPRLCNEAKPIKLCAPLGISDSVVHKKPRKFIRVASIVLASIVFGGVNFTASVSGDAFFMGAAFAQTKNLTQDGDSQPQNRSPRLVTPNDAESGSLLFQSTTPGKYIQAPALVTDVEISVSGPIVRTKVTQRFENSSDLWVEGVYVFPLPDGGAIDTLKMQIGDRFIEGKIEERKKAKAIYEAAKAQGKKASLLEQERPNIFTNSVANIGPGETIIIQMEYQETVKLDNNEFSLRYPMVVAPRFNPVSDIAPTVVMASLDETTGWSVPDPVPDRNRISPPVLNPKLGDVNNVHLSVNLDAGFALGEIVSSYHPVKIDYEGEAVAKLTLSNKSTPANRDFALTWRPKAKQAPTAALFTEEINGEPYYLLMVTPPTTQSGEMNGGTHQEVQPPAREITFVIDTSGSMGGISIRQARQSLAMAIGRLQQGDLFNVIEFNSQTFPLFNRPQPVTPDNLSSALTWVEGLEARGGTRMLPALKTALIDHVKDDDRLRQVIFLTDGAIGNEQQLFETIANNRGDARIFTVGIGSAPNSYFMSRAAELGQGSFTHIGSVREVAERMQALFVKLETPAVTNIVAQWPDGIKAEMWPSPIPDIYQGETLVVAAHASQMPDFSGSLSQGKLEDTLWVSGKNGDEPWKVGLPLGKASKREGVSKLWARKKIAALELNRVRRNRRGTANGEDLNSMILDVALAHKLVSRLTSLVAVDITPSRPEDVTLATQKLPLNLPHGWDFEKVFGADIAVANYALPVEGLKGRTVLEKSQDDQTKAGQTNQSKSGVKLPQTATLSDVKIMRGLLLMLVAAGLFAWARGRESVINRLAKNEGA